MAQIFLIICHLTLKIFAIYLKKLQDTHLAFIEFSKYESSMNLIKKISRAKYKCFCLTCFHQFSFKLISYIVMVECVSRILVLLPSASFIINL